MKLERVSGLLCHPTSFPSPFGIGDLGQGAYDFIDFCKKSGTRLWQVLPLGPTSMGNSPYQSFSSFAGNPLLISPEKMAKKGLLNKSDIAVDEEFSTDKVDYEKASTLKTKIFKIAFENFKKDKSFSKDFLNFCKENDFWLDDYTLFISLKQYLIKERKNEVNSKGYLAFAKEYKKYLTQSQIDDSYYGAVWNSFDNEIKTREKEAVAKYSKLLEEEIYYHKFLQFVFYEQWKELKQYANKNDIKIIGDIPIFVAMDSHDVWANPSLFQLDSKLVLKKVAGVPPDYFSEYGQLWGNPLYEWKKHEEEKFAWWIKRIKFSLNVVDIVRIDHFRGFEAYWAVPFGEQTAVNGKWVKAPGVKLFEEVRKELGELPIIAEDLGVITEGVEFLRDSFNFPGMRILQFGMEEGHNSPYLPHNFETVNTVVYTGTHDNDTTVGWYQKMDEKTKDYFRRYMNVSGESSSLDLIRLAISSTASFAIVPIWDVFSLDSYHRMNTPGVPFGNWETRYDSSMLKEEFGSYLLYLNQMFNRCNDKDVKKKEVIEVTDL